MPDIAVASMTFLEGVTAQLSMTHRLAHMVLDGFSEDEALWKPQPAGNSVNWIAGHIVAIRERVLAHAGLPATLGERALPYREKAWPAEAEAVSLAQIVAAFDASQAPLLGWIRGLDAETLAGEPPFFPGGRSMTLEIFLATSVFHESYHLGQIGLLRRLLGKTGAL